MNLSIPVAPLLPVLVFAAPASGLESWGVPDFAQRDKQEHALGGALVGAATTAALEHLAPRWKPWQRVVAGVAAAAVVAVAKEAYDARHPHTHDCDPKDALATVAGGAAGALSVELVWHF